MLFCCVLIVVFFRILFVYCETMPGSKNIVHIVSICFFCLVCFSVYTINDVSPACTYIHTHIPMYVHTSPRL